MSAIVDTIYDAQVNVHDILKVTETHGDFDIPQAYIYQAELIERYLNDGKVIVGYKMGLTSRSKMEQMGVDSPIHGVLFEDMLMEDFSPDYRRLIHPKAEPEIAFKISEDVPLDATAEELEASIGFIAPAIDIIDSRFRDFKFTMADVVADNCSGAQFAVGKWLPYDAAIQLDSINATLRINGEDKRSGVSSAVLGSPFEALIELHRSLAAEGIALHKDQVILTGAITAAETIKPGDMITNSTDALGEVTIK